MPFADCRSVKMEPETARGMVGSTPGGWGWGPVTHSTVGLGWFRGLQQDDVITPQAALTSASSGQEPSIFSLSPHGHSVSPGKTHIDKTHRPGPSTLQTVNTPGSPRTTALPVPARRFPPDDTTTLGSGYVEQETRERQPQVVGTERRKPSPGQPSIDHTTSSAGPMNDVMSSQWTSTDSGGGGAGLTYCRKQPPVTNGISPLSGPAQQQHPAHGGFVGYGCSTMDHTGGGGCGGGGGGSSNSGDSGGSNSSGGYDNASRETFFIPPDPHLWSPEHVQRWLELVSREHGLRALDCMRFSQVDGRVLCRMRREDFLQLAGPYEADVLLASLTYLRRACISSIAPEAVTGNGRHWTCMSPSIHDPLTSVTRQDNTEFSKCSWFSSPVSASRTFGYNQPSFSTSCFGKTYPDAPSPTWRMQDPYKLFGQLTSRLCGTGTGQIQLWQFLLELLSDTRNAACITWEGTNGEFKLVDPDEVARRWGERKSKPNMNYDKLSRALRYYYDKNIMTKVHGKRYAYRFDFAGLAQAIQPSSPPESSPPYRTADWMLSPANPYGAQAKPHLSHYPSPSPQMNPALLGPGHAYWAGHHSQHHAHHAAHHNPHHGAVYSAFHASGISGTAGQLASHLSSCYA